MVDVSVIVPVYNVEKYLKASIGSILKQSYENLEVILVDDGSTDTSGKICDDFACQDKRVKVIHKKNEGAGFARNTGMDCACGEYLYFFDSDDYAEPNLIEDNYKLAKESRADIVIFGYKQYENNSIKEYLPECKGTRTYEEFWSNYEQSIKGIPDSLWSKMFLRKFVAENGIRSVNTKHWEDGRFLYDAYTSHFHCVAYNNASYYRYIRREGSATFGYLSDRLHHDCAYMKYLREALKSTPCHQEQYVKVLNSKYQASIEDGIIHLACSKGRIKEKAMQLKSELEDPCLQNLVSQIRITSANHIIYKFEWAMLKLRWYRLLLLLIRFWIVGKYSSSGKQKGTSGDN